MERYEDTKKAFDTAKRLHEDAYGALEVGTHTYVPIYVMDNVYKSAPEEHKHLFEMYTKVVASAEKGFMSSRLMFQITFSDGAVVGHHGLDNYCIHDPKGEHKSILPTFEPAGKKKRLAKGVSKEFEMAVRWLMTQSDFRPMLTQLLLDPDVPSVAKKIKL